MDTYLRIEMGTAPKPGPLNSNKQTFVPGPQRTGKEVC